MNFRAAVLSCLIIFFLIFTSCSNSIEIPETSSEKKTTEEISEIKTEEVPVTTKKEHISIDDYNKVTGEGGKKQIMYDDPNFNPFLSVEARVDLDRFESEIKKLEAVPREKGKIIFIGSSGFTRWSGTYGNIELEDRILDKNGNKVAINFGFGGSTVHELCNYYKRLIKPYSPKAIVVTSVINDYGFQYTNTEMIKLLAWFFNQARTDNPGIKLYVTDWRPTAKDRTESEIKRFLEFNQMLKDYASMHDDVTVIELSKEAFYYTSPEYAGTYTNINKDIFIDDQIHFVPDKDGGTGYSEFTRIFTEALKDIL